MESDDSLPVLTDLEIDFPTLTPSTLGQPIDPIVIFLSPPSITIPSNPASPDEKLDSVSTTQGLSTVCSTTTATIDQLQPPTISSSVGDARSKITSSRKERNRSKQKLRSLQRPANKDNNSRDQVTIARQHKREHFARLGRVVKCPRFNPHIHYRLRPEFPSCDTLLGQPTTRVHYSHYDSPPSATVCSASSYNSQLTAITQNFVFFILLRSNGWIY